MCSAMAQRLLWVSHFLPFWMRLTTIVCGCGGVCGSGEITFHLTSHISELRKLSEQIISSWIWFRWEDSVFQIWIWCHKLMGLWHLWHMGVFCVWEGYGLIRSQKVGGRLLLWKPPINLTTQYSHIQTIPIHMNLGLAWPIEH